MVDLGAKTVQVKGAGSQGFPAPAHTAPQCRAGGQIPSGSDLHPWSHNRGYALWKSAFVKEHVGVIADPFNSSHVLYFFLLVL